MIRKNKRDPSGSMVIWNLGFVSSQECLRFDLAEDGGEARWGNTVVSSN